MGLSAESYFIEHDTEKDHSNKADEVLVFKLLELLVVHHFVLSVILGLRGAVAFALAMRNTESVPRQMMLTSVLIVVLVTVIINGGATMSVLSFLKIR